MEINGAFDLLQDLTPIEQLADSTENLSELTDSDFQQLLMQETIKEAEFFAEFDKALPVAGKELPLDVEPSQLKSSELPLNSIEVQPEKQLEAEVPETEDPVFIMTNLLMQLPSTPTKIDFHFYSAEPQPGNLLLVEQDVMLKQLLPDIDNIQRVALMAENDLPEIANSVQQSFALLEPGMEASITAGNPVQSDFHKQNTLSLADNLINDEESQRTFFEISEHATQLREDSMVTQSAEKLSFLLEPNHDSEVSEQNFQEQEMQSLQPFGSKELAKETLVVPHKNPQTEAFSNIFQEKLTDKISLLVNRNENVAQIQIDPPELGKIDITIEQSDDKTHIKFFAQVEQTKQLIENTVDKLKMHLAQSGIELGQVDVSAGNQNQRQYAQTLPNASNGYHEASQKEVDINTSRVVVSDNSQLLDLYI